MTDLPMIKAPEESMSEKVEHTPIPWEMQEADPSEGVGIIGSNLGGLVAISCMQPTEFDAGDTRRAEANAALIVHSVNSLPYLVEALEALQLQALQSSVNDPANEWGQEALAMTRAALSKYRGERG